VNDSNRSTGGPILIGILIIAVVAVGSYLGLSLVGRVAVRTSVVATASPITPASTPTATSSALPTQPLATAAPTAAPTPAPTAAPVPTAAVFDPAATGALLSSIHPKVASACVVLTPESSGVEPTAIAALSCRQGADTAIYQAFSDDATMQDLYSRILADAGLGTDIPGCWSGSVGEVDYGVGRAACWIDASGGAKRVMWSYPPMHVLGQASAKSGSLHDLLSWWWYRARISEEPIGSNGYTSDQQYLIDQIPSWLVDACEPYDPMTDSSSYKPVGSLGSIDCYPKGLHLQDVGWFRFATPAALAAWYDYRLGLAKVLPYSGGCYDGKAGDTSWAAGRVSCFLTAKEPRIRWANDGALIYGVANGTSGYNLGLLFSWWSSAGLP
jgi:hypothetical protein